VGFEELVVLSVTAFIVGLSGALMPGTVLVAVVLHATEKGWKAGPLIVLGHMLLEALLGIMLVLGLSTIMGIQMVRTAIGFVGGSFLLWTGVGLLKTSRNADLGAGSKPNGSSRFSSTPVLSGFLASAVNPYFYVWWATVGNVFTMRGFELAGLLGVAVFLLSHWMSDLSWYTSVSWSIGRSQGYMTNRISRMVFGVCGVFLLILGSLFLYEAANGTI
jgi:threonine/homoserine/homoserine lactone efflux protein